MRKTELTPDCSRCAALCCIGLAFDKSESFAFDKPAGEACRNLGPEHACTIHTRLEESGFSGCVLYDCFGAGQRVVEEVFDGQSWREDKALLEPMMEALRVLRPVHEMLLMLETARDLPLSVPQSAQLDELVSALSPAEGWTREKLARFPLRQRQDEVQAFLSGLRDLVPQH